MRVPVRVLNNLLVGLLCCVLVFLLPWARAAEAAEIGDAERGRLLYESGQAADGQPLRAQRTGIGPLHPSAVACALCHRPSAMGDAEGSLFAPALVGPVLFAPAVPHSPTRVAPGTTRQWMRYQQRPAYDLASLARALADGVDPSGAPLAPAMPRYSLSAQQVADLAAHLHRLGQDQPAGLADNAIHLASVFTPQASPQRQRTVRLAMQAWAQHNSFGPRRVQWQAWVLQGPPDTWASQLQAHWQRQPVYALVSGAGGTEWAPVQQFCERQRTPCIFPSTDSVPADPRRRYSAYLSAGVEAEASILARKLSELPLSSADPSRLIQIPRGPVGERAAAALAQRLTAQGRANELHPWPADKTWLQMRHSLGLRGGDTVVLWAPTESAQSVLNDSAFVAQTHAQGHAQTQAQATPALLVLSGQMSPPATLQVPAAWRSSLRWVSLRSDPTRFAGAAAMSLAPWTQLQGLPADLDQATLGDVHAATFFFGDAMARLRGSLSADHLMERLEAAVDLRPAGGAYFRLSLGPNQRVAAQGGHWLGFPTPQATQAMPMGIFTRSDDTP